MIHVFIATLRDQKHVRAYYEAEVLPPANAPSMEGHHAHASRPEWLRISDTLVASPVQRGDVSRGLQGYGQDGAPVARNAGVCGLRSVTDFTFSAHKSPRDVS
ncbi:hypothetical protein [Roseomonas chloroacetimidivorans]|uniref:hypothetical protein n=1 Tax=Roseomonas chloroacetimidivorans TaxID=1766656 RepID=UPI003C739C19